jgi:hypothetical protein
MADFIPELISCTLLNVGKQPAIHTREWHDGSASAALVAQLLERRSGSDDAPGGRLRHLQSGGPACMALL